MAKIFIEEKKKLGKINAEIYGQFSEHLGRGIYEGLYVGEDSNIPNVNGMRKDVVDALKQLNIPVLRWPGGCFAEEYHWKDGIGPKEKRKKQVNAIWGGVTEDNSFGTHEYFELCRQLGCKTYINANLGSGTVREMAEWVEYMTFTGISPLADERARNGHAEPWKVDYLGIGNENWGNGGNMTPEFYADLYRQYQSFIHDYLPEHHICKICGGANVDDYEWTQGVLKETHRHALPQFHGFMDGLSLHYYVHPEGWEIKGSATEFDENVWYKSLAKAAYMETLINRHGAIMDTFDPEKKIGMIVDEWGCWFTCEQGTTPGFLYQQNTMRDATVAAMTLNIFNRHCDRVKMANIAQMINVLQSMALTKGTDMLLTPTYYIFKMYREHQNAELLGTETENVRKIGTQKEYQIEQLSVSASEKGDGAITCTIVNTSATEMLPIELCVRDRMISKVTASVLTGEMQDHNTFEDLQKVKEKPFTDFTIRRDGIIYFTAPACSVFSFQILC